MALDFEQLQQPIVEMARAAGERAQNRADRLDKLVAAVQKYSTDWESLAAHRERMDNYLKQERPVRATAVPLRLSGAGMDAGRPTSTVPDEATVIAVDGSQIVPGRHDPYVYYLLNVGGIVYHHGRDRVPQVFSRPSLHFPAPQDLDDTRFGGRGQVSVKRDLAEIEMLAVQSGRQAAVAADLPVLAIMDQRLLYVPIGDGGQNFPEQTIEKWIKQMERMEDAGAWLVGYIDSPRKDSVVALMQALYPQNDPDAALWDGLTDTDLFGRLLADGERSRVFLNLSQSNQTYRRQRPSCEICFFFINVGGNIARVDLPRWVADEPQVVTAVHGLLADQCAILKTGYPYVLMRADEEAVVGQLEKQELEMRIGRGMDAAGNVPTDHTRKQQSKELARSGKQRHEV